LVQSTSLQLMSTFVDINFVSFVRYTTAWGRTSASAPVCRHLGYDFAFRVRPYTSNVIAISPIIRFVSESIFVAVIVITSSKDRARLCDFSHFWAGW